MKKTSYGKLVSVLLLFLMGIGLFPCLAFADYGLPTLDIHLNNTTIQVINGGSKEEKYPDNDLALYDADGNVLLEQSGVEVKGRGNTTWLQPKKPYQIKFEKKQNLFGLGKSKKWVLLANYLDPSFLRNDFALSIARDSGIVGTTDGQFVWLTVDGEDLGLYYLCHKPSAGSESVDLSDMFGVLFELDQPYMDEDIDFFSAVGDHFNLKDAVNDDEADQRTAARIFEDKWNTAYAAAAAGDWETVSDYLDTDSFCRYYLLNELGVNLDATVTSFFIYMDGADDVLHAGPAWDYDLCFGNLWRTHTQRMWCYKSLRNDNDPNSHILQILMDIPQFRQRACEIWTYEMRPVLEQCAANLGQNAKQIRAAAKADHKIWGLSAFDAAVELLYDWTLSHAESMDLWYEPIESVKEGTCQIFMDGLYLTAEGLTTNSERLKLTKLDDGFFLLGNLSDSLYLTGGAVPDEPTGIPQTCERRLLNTQEWMVQPTDGGVRVYNKDSGLYLKVVDGHLEEGRYAKETCEFQFVSTADRDQLVEEFVVRLYWHLLNRDLDDSGKVTWTENLIDGMPASKIVEGITRSREFLGKQISDSDYVRMLYLARLDREASEEEVDIWTGILEDGYTRKKLIEGVANSREYDNLCAAYGIVAGDYLSDDILDTNSTYRRYVIRMYKDLLNRKWDESGLRAWVGYMVDGVSAQKVAISFASSSEFKNRGLSEKEAARMIFFACMKREPDAIELSEYRRYLRRSGTAAMILFLNNSLGIVL